MVTSLALPPVGQLLTWGVVAPRNHSPITQMSWKAFLVTKRIVAVAVIATLVVLSITAVGRTGHGARVQPHSRRK